MDLLHDEPFAELAGTTLRFDLALPEGPGPHPAVVCIHGGGWISGAKEEMSELAVGLAANGFASACPEYRLAPLHPFPAAAEDVQGFVRFLRSNSARWGLNPDAIGALGNSAGGHLAAMSAATDVPDESGTSSRVNAAVAICPLTDLVDPASHHFPVSLGFIEQFLGGPYEGLEDRYRKASPAVHVDAACAPMFLVHGEADDIVPISQSDRLAAALEAAGVRHTYRKLPGEGHSFSLAAWEGIVRQYLDFFGETLPRAAAGTRSLQ